MSNFTSLAAKLREQLAELEQLFAEASPDAKAIAALLMVGAMTPTQRAQFAELAQKAQEGEQGASSPNRPERAESE